MNEPVRKLHVLIACEESQAEAQAFRKLGHLAYSCDIKKCRRGGHKDWHIMGDVSPFLHGETEFTTEDGTQHNVEYWDLIISHPPCTYLCKVSSIHMRKNADGWRYTSLGWQHVNCDRFDKMLAARAFFFSCFAAEAKYVAVENPLPMALAKLPPPTAFACPSWYGVKYTKKTLYWLRNLPPLVAEIDFPQPKSFVGASRGAYRSRTFPQLAQAMARQWSSYILADIRHEDEMTKLADEAEDNSIG